MITEDENVNTGEEKKPTSRERSIAILGQRYPDRTFGEDEDLLEVFIEAANEDNEYRQKANEVNQKLADLFEAEPDLYNIVRDALQGAPGMVAIAKNITPEDLQAATSSPEFENWDQNIGSRQRKLEEKRKMEAEAEANIEEAMNVAESYAKSKEMSPEEAQAFYDKVDETLQPIYTGKITPYFLDIMWRATNYETHMAQQRELGAAKGRNEKVIAEKTPTDSMPKLNSGSEIQSAPTPESYMDKFTKKS